MGLPHGRVSRAAGAVARAQDDAIPGHRIDLAELAAKRFEINRAVVWCPCEPEKTTIVSDVIACHQAAVADAGRVALPSVARVEVGHSMCC